MRASILILMSVFMGAGFWFGCSDQNFSSATDKLVSANQNIDQSGELQRNPGKDNPDDIHIIENANPSDDDGTHKGYLVFKNTASEEDGEEYAVRKPLTLLFLIDKTGSMNSYIDTVKNNVKSFVSNLRTRNFEVKLGFISYEDEIISEMDFTSDVTVFENELDKIIVAGGQDGPEAGLTAVIKGVERFNALASDNSLKVMVLFSDNVSHDNPVIESDERDCSINSTVSSLKGLSKDLQEQIKLFYSVPTVQRSSCKEYSNPTTQFDDILHTGFDKLDTSIVKGGHIGWPFDESSLLDTLPTMIESVSRSKILCLVNSVSINIDRTTSVEYSNTFQEEYKLFKAGKESSLSITSNKVVNFLKRADTEKTISVTQSCFDMVDVNSNNFSTPVTVKTIKIPYEFRE